jgi:arsenical pump membrane protein
LQAVGRNRPRAPPAHADEAPLLQWLPRYLAPSVLSILVTFIVLRWTQRGALRQNLSEDVPAPQLSAAGKTAALGIVATPIVLLGASALDIQLGLPTAVARLATPTIVLTRQRKSPWHTVKDISWGVLPLVAGLFVLVEALDKTGLIATIGALLRLEATKSQAGAAWSAGVLLAFVSNLMNNLPAGLVAASALQNADASDLVRRAVVIGVDIGPNLSVTGSLATILWLTALRREGLTVSAWTFLKLGALVMPPALPVAIGASLASG